MAPSWLDDHRESSLERAYDTEEPRSKVAAGAFLV